jgi:hypothetical protein
MVTGDNLLFNEEFRITSWFYLNTVLSKNTFKDTSTIYELKWHKSFISFSLSSWDKLVKDLKRTTNAGNHC